ncbi:hypothetical protein [Nocardia jiangsuensis]|uniref:Uncharacterized protein n=1 Tax=Nocardia jiangsuensis TaxID=1691563 RepID=A0ABV8DND2_9NOCA
MAVPPYLQPFVLTLPEHPRRREGTIEVIDVPNGQHSFDVLDHTDESRAAVERAVRWVGRLNAEGID